MYLMETDPKDRKNIEWLVTNGLGGYASSTGIGMNTRKYHGLLVAATEAPVGRRVLLSSLDEEISIEGEMYELATHQYPGTLHPEGYRFLEDFYAEPFPSFHYRIGDIVLRKTIMMPGAKNTSIVRYDISNPQARKAVLRIFPLVNDRDIHKLTRAGEIHFSQEATRYGTTVKGGETSLELYSDMVYKPQGYWYYNSCYEVELSRGYPYMEDIFNPGHFEASIGKGESSFFIVASLVTGDKARPSIADIRRLYDDELRQSIPVDTEKDGTTFIHRLKKAAGQFLVHRRSTNASSVIAGYHWFADWGRDAMIALPGLTLVTGNYNGAKEILTTFASYTRDGLIPNLFPDDPSMEPAYNTVDASLWFVHAVGKYLEYTGDLDFVASIWDTLVSIVENYQNGTKNNIKMDSDGLISQGAQLTWMDAKCGDKEMTPRSGKTCEINALWYNALMYISEIGEGLGKDVSPYLEIARMTKESFNKEFINEEMGCLYDCIPGNGSIKDASIRPNQLFAVSLTFTMLAPDLEKSIVEIVRRELLTPYGLRTLAPSDATYIGKYEGNTESRDMAYHNGTVWPWLLGPYITAYIKVHGSTDRSKMEMTALLEQGIKGHLDEAGIGSISEVFDGDAPHRPGGCIAQAWSVAEILRACVKDIGMDQA